jgi:hypothetical protein
MIVESKIPLDEYSVYSIYTLGVRDYNRITDYKKIWGLTGFKSAGLYANYYDREDERVYFGIIKGQTELEKHHLLGCVLVYLTSESSLEVEKVFELFSDNRFSIDVSRDRHYSVLSSLQKQIQGSIVVYKKWGGVSLEIYGDNVDQILDESLLPLSEVIEY